MHCDPAGAAVAHPDGAVEVGVAVLPDGAEVHRGPAARATVVPPAAHRGEAHRAVAASAVSVVASVSARARAARREAVARHAAVEHAVAPDALVVPPVGAVDRLVVGRRAAVYERPCAWVASPRIAAGADDAGGRP